MAKQDLNEQDLSPIAQHLNEWYGGNIRSVCSRLDGVIFMLFFLEEEAFSRHEIQQAGYALKQLRDCFEEVCDKKAPL
jgi:hypothetical protein